MRSFGADQFAERPGVLAAIIAAPDQPENVFPVDAVVGHEIAQQNRRIESAKIDALGQAVRNEHALRQPHRQRAAPQEADDRLADRLLGRPVHVPQSKPKQQIEQLVVLVDGEVGQFGQLVVAEDQMDLLRDTWSISSATSSRIVCDMQPPFG